ncbi:MAG TPA: RNase P subunit p30 family protein [Methanoregula sp.]|nr:RNase P subunit p30 family protein [Methanoregula sp.]
MKITDACIYPYPCGDSSVRRMALEARSLGFDRLVAADTTPCQFHDIEVLNGIFIRDTRVKDLITRVRRERDGKAIVSVQAGDNGFNRAAIGIKGVHILRGVQSADKTAFDHVAARMAADNQVAVDIDLSPLISGRGVTRQRAMHRYRDILVLERRFEFPITLSSYARSVLEMRAVREISGICSLIGMDTPDVERAFAGIDTVTASPDLSVRVV